MNHKQMAHEFIKSFLNGTETVVDMTGGNGHDTYFLAHYAKKVIAIDIQEAAIISTKKRCKDLTNIEYFLGSHVDYPYEKIAPISGAIYNLGYLPGSDKSCITQANSTLDSLKEIESHLTHFIVISCYLGHDGGIEEYEAISEYIKLKGWNYELLKYDTPLSPVTYLIKLNNKIGNHTPVYEELR